MKSAKIFLIGMYLHLALSIGVPIGILGIQEWNTTSIGMLFLYFIVIGAVQLIGWICVGMAASAYLKGNLAALQKGWILLKLGSLPFYVINFLYSFLVWFSLVGASRGILIFLVPIPIIITCLMIFQSGWVGVCYIMLLRKQPENRGRPGSFHYILQLLPVLDVISTVILLATFHTGVQARPSESMRG